MKILLPLISAAALSLSAAAGAQTAPAQPTPPAAPAAPAPAAHAALSVETTPIDELLKNPKAMEILKKHLPEVAGQEDQLAMAGSMTLRDIQAYAADAITDEKLAAIEADFKALSAS